jgi:hypothetical protein
VLQVPISLGAIQKVLDRVTRAIDPYYAVIARQARQAAVNYIDETPWYCLNTLEWLWVMASERVAFYPGLFISLKIDQRRYVWNRTEPYNNRIPESSRSYHKLIRSS